MWKDNLNSEKKIKKKKILFLRFFLLGFFFETTKQPQKVNEYAFVFILLLFLYPSVLFVNLFWIAPIQRFKNEKLTNIFQFDFSANVFQQQPTTTTTRTKWEDGKSAFNEARQILGL